MEEMNPILEIVSAAGLLIEHPGCWQGIAYLWADDLHGEPGRPFARYLFTFTDAEQWNRWEQWGDGFVTEVIEPVYFQTANDISWNLYWISVLEDEQLSQIDPSQRLSFSSNTEYTRNLMVPLEHLSEWIPVGRIPEDEGDREITSPSENWLEQLDQAGLAFCLDEYSQKALDAYVEETAEVRKAAAEPADTPVGRQRLTMLQSIAIQKSFREHYYPKDWIIPLQTVNLLYGPNGTGKTSVLSAIELAMTGEIRSFTDLEDASAEAGVVLSATVDGRTVELRPPREAAEKKEREQQFYKSRNTNRTASQLQNLFHRFNYLSVEETFLFASEQPDISEIFSQILYGPETSGMWRNLGRYKDKCGSLITKYEQDLAALVSHLEKLSQASPVDRAALRAYLDASGLRFGPEMPLQEILTKTQALMAEYDKVREFAPVLSQDQLREEWDRYEERRRTVSEQIEKLEYKLEQTEVRKNDLINTEAQLEEACQKIEQVLTPIQAFEPFVKQLQFRMGHEVALEEYQQCLAQQTAFEERAAQLERLIESYGETLAMPPSKTIQQIRKEMREIQDKRLSLARILDTQQSQIEREDLTREKRTTLFSVLRTTGMELYQMDKHRDSCPMCGTKGITEAVLQKYLEKESVQGSQWLEELRQAVYDTENEIQHTKTLLKKLGQQEIAAQEYHDALNAVKQRFPEIQNIADLHQEYANAQRKLREAEAQTAQMWESLQAELGKSNVTGTIEEIWDSRQRLLERIPSGYVSSRQDVSDQELIDAVVSRQKKWEERKEDYGKRLSRCQAALKKQNDAPDEFANLLEQRRSQLEQVETQLFRFARISAFWAATEPMVADSALSGKAVRDICRNIRDSISDIMASSRHEEDRKAYQKKLDQITERLVRCRTLQNTLERLQPPKVYAEAFIAQNVTKISRIFLALHSPQEFSRLDIKDRKLVAFRNEEMVPISRMSTGQRTALVIAVFFQMNLATPSVPSFLLLDEPVANIDDLNVLALMDFLRQIVLTHKRQIFFTTANRNVAKLFRRKFSFLLEGFQEFRFFREKENFLRIEQRSYDQNRLLEHLNL